jgi:hypothetical protein
VTILIVSLQSRILRLVPSKIDAQRSREQSAHGAARPRNGGTTITVVSQVATAPSASIAAHVTDVTPMGKRDPDGGEQVVETGAVPPDTVGWSGIATGSPLDVRGIGTGQTMAIGPLDGAIALTSTEGALRLPAASYA